MPIKLIATDLDGTLLTGIRRKNAPPLHYGIPEENAAAIREAQAAGIIVAMASGRMCDDAAIYAVDRQLDMPVIGLNGGTIALHPLGDILYSSPMAEQEARALTELVRSSGFVFALFGARRLWSYSPDKRLDHVWGGHIGSERTHTVYTSGPEALEEIFQAGIHKLVVIDLMHSGRLPDLRAACLQAVPDCVITSSWADNIEINPAGVNKGSALQKLAEHFSIPMEEVMAIGDNDNDLSMLTAAGCGVVMGNGSAAAKRAAQYQTLDCDDFGFAAAVRCLALGQTQPGVERL